MVHSTAPLLLRSTLTWPVGGGFPADVSTVAVAVVAVPTWVGLGSNETRVTRVTAGGGTVIVLVSVAELLARLPSTAVPGARMDAVFTIVPVADGETAQVAV